MTEPAVLEIQFITYERLMIPGKATVGVYGQILRIGPGEVGEKFPYRSPAEQMIHYKGQQHYMLIAAYDHRGQQVPHPDENVRLDGGEGEVPVTQAATAPRGVHEVTSRRTGYTGDVPEDPTQRAKGDKVRVIHDEETLEEKTRKEEEGGDEDDKPKSTRRKSAPKASKNSEGKRTIVRKRK